MTSPVPSEAAVTEPPDLPVRIVVGRNGAYWRDYGDHYSMPPVSTDNDPVEVFAVFVRSRITEAEEWAREAALRSARLPGPDPIREALVQAGDRLEHIFEVIHPGPMTDDEMHDLAQSSWFGKEEVEDAISAHPSTPVRPDRYTVTNGRGVWQVRREDGFVYTAASEAEARRYADGLNQSGHPATPARPDPSNDDLPVGWSGDPGHPGGVLCGECGELDRHAPGCPEATPARPDPCSYCGSVNGETPVGAFHSDPMTGDTLRAAIAAATDLTNPRLSEVDWDNVAAVFDTPVRPDLTAAVAVLRADAVDTHREPMWRYGVRHTLSVIEAALRAEQVEPAPRDPIADRYEASITQMQAEDSRGRAEQVERPDLDVDGLAFRALIWELESEATLPPRPTQYRRGWAAAHTSAVHLLRVALAAALSDQASERRTG